MNQKFKFPFTDRQVQMVSHPAKILHIGCGTKSGKSMGLFCWLIEGLLNGQACCFTGPWFFRSRAAFDQIKLLLESYIKRRQVKINEARMQISAVGGGFLDFTSADNVNAAFGSNYDRVVIDEASRCPREIYPAALTTISATNGKLRLAFNVELGSKNWAIANLLRVQRMTEAERLAASEGYLTFPTGGDGLVDPSIVEMMKSQMPLPLWEALYLGRIPDSDCSLFRNLDRIFTGRELDTPVHGEHYFMGVDLARKQDYTVVTIVDSHGNIVATDRFTLMSWSLQVERCAMWYRTFHCQKVVCDATGVGDVVAEEFEKAGMNVEPFIITVPSRRQLIEQLVLSCDNREITIPASEKFKVYRTELESMEYTLDGNSIRYAVGSGQHDDALFSLALAVHAFRASRGFVLGLVELLKRTARDIVEGVRNASGQLINPPAPPPRLLPPVIEVAPKPVDNFAEWQKTNRAPACVTCHSESTTFNSARKVFCNQCHGVDGVVPEPTGQCCGSFLPQITASGIKCGNCGHQQSNPGAVIGMSRRDYARSRFSPLVR